MIPIPLRDAVWSALMGQPSEDRIELLAPCLMPDHVHLLLRPAELDLLTFIGTWKSFTTRLAQQQGHRGALWQPGMWGRSIRDASDFASTLAYIACNPVEAGLVDDSDAYRWLWTANVEA